MSRFDRQGIVLLLVLQLAVAPVSALAQSGNADSGGPEIACATQAAANESCPCCPAVSCDLQACGISCGATALIPGSQAITFDRISLSPILQRMKSLPSPVYAPLNPPPIR